MDTAKLTAILESPAFAEAIQNMTGVEELKAYLADNGVELTDAQLEDMLAAIAQDNAPSGELTEDQLTGVAGGGALKDLWNACSAAWKWGWKKGKQFFEWEQSLYK